MPLHLPPTTPLLALLFLASASACSISLPSLSPIPHNTTLSLAPTICIAPSASDASLVLTLAGETLLTLPLNSSCQKPILTAAIPATPGNKRLSLEATTPAGLLCAASNTLLVTGVAFAAPPVLPLPTTPARYPLIVVTASGATLTGGTAGAVVALRGTGAELDAATGEVVVDGGRGEVEVFADGGGMKFQVGGNEAVEQVDVRVEVVQGLVAVGESDEIVLKVFGGDGGGELVLGVEGGKRRLEGKDAEVGDDGGREVRFFVEAFQGQIEFARYEVAGVAVVVEGLRVGRVFETKLSVLLSSFDAERGVVVLPIVCGRVNMPVVMAKYTLPPQVDGVPVFEYHYRAGRDREWTRLGGGKGSVLMAVDEPGLFGSERQKDETVEVRARASLSGYPDLETKASVVIARRLEPDVIGVSVLAPQTSVLVSLGVCDESDVPPALPGSIEGSISSAIHCPDPDSVLQEATWTLDGKEVRDTVGDLLSDSAPDGPVKLGFGSGIVLPRSVRDAEGAADASVGLAVRFVDVETKETLGLGESVGEVVRRTANRPVALIGSGEREVSVAVGKEFVVAGVDADDETAEGIAFAWECAALDDDGADAGECGEELLPKIAAEGESRFKAKASEAGIFAYSLTVTRRGVSSRKEVWRVNAEERDKDYQIFPPGGRIFAGGSRVISMTNPCRAVLLPHESLVHIPQPEFASEVSEKGLDVQYALIGDDGSGRNLDVQYALIGDDGSGRNLLAGADMLIEGSGFWSLGQRKRPLLGIQGGKLSPGKHKLLAGFGKKELTGDSVPRSVWEFTVLSPPTLTVSELPVSNGTAGETLFHSAAISSPEGFLFYFALRRERSDDPMKRRITPDACLGGCSGGRVVSFLVEEPGEYHVQVDLVSADDTVIASAFADGMLSVSPQEGTEAATDDSRLFIAGARSQNNEDAFLRAVERLGKQLNSSVVEVDGDFAAKTAAGLLTMASKSLLTPMLAARIVGASTGLLSAPLTTDLARDLFKTISAAVGRISQLNTGAHMNPLLIAFTRRAESRLRESRTLLSLSFRQLSEKEESGISGSGQTPSNSNFDADLSSRRLRDAATNYLTASYFRGRGCVDNMSEVGLQQGISLRGASSCYAGQNKLARQCSSNRSPNLIAGESVVVGLASSTGSGKNLAPSKDSSPERLWSSVYTPVGFRQKASGDALSFPTSPVCVNLTIPILTGRSAQPDLDKFFTSNSKIRCSKALRLYRRKRPQDDVEQVNLPSESDWISLTDDDSTMWLYVPSAAGEEWFASIDTEELMSCFSNIDGVSVNLWPIILVAVALLLALVLFCVFCILRRRRRNLSKPWLRDLDNPINASDLQVSAGDSIFGHGASCLDKPLDRKIGGAWTVDETDIADDFDTFGRLFSDDGASSTIYTDDSSADLSGNFMHKYPDPPLTGLS